MQRILFVLLLCTFTHLPAQKLYLYPTAAIAPRGSYQTVTAIVNGVNNKTVTWSVNNRATLVGANPCVVNEPCTIAVYDTTAETDALTATSNANGSVVGTSTITFTPSPTPVTTHPRFIITGAMLPALRAKTTSGNVPYQVMKNSAVAAYKKDASLWSWTCNGGTGQPSTPQYQVGKEDDAQLFAEMALLDPTDSSYKWGCYGHDLWLYIMNGYTTGAENPGGNPWSDASGSYALTTDWLIGAGALSSTEQAAIRGDFYKLAQGIISNSHGNGYTPPTTLSKFNSSALFNQGIAQGPTSDIQNQRSMGNNYSFSRMLILAAIGLTFNDTNDDDPPLANTCSATRYQICPDGTAGSLHAFWNYVDGSMLYLMNAHLEDPTVGWKEYQAAYHNLPKSPTCLYGEGPQWPCFGDGRDGESSEGAWYSYSFSRLRDMLNLLHTAGMDDPILYGPQISLGTSSWWDLKYVEDAEFLTGISAKNVQICEHCVVPAYSYLQTGDSYTYFRDVNDMLTEASMMAADSYTGRTDRVNALKWLVLNMAYGGPLGKTNGCTTYCGFDAALANPYIGGSAALDLFISLPAGDPVSALPADPRPSMPTDLYAGSFNQHLMVRNGWSSPTLFSAYAPNSLINHELQWAGRFDIFANGEYITKGRTVFNDYNYFLSAAPQSNIASIINAIPPGSDAKPCETTSMNCGFVTWAAVSGGQFWQADQAGFVPLLHSELPAYAAFIVNTVNVYNGIPTWQNTPVYNYVTGASRSIVYLRGTNQVALYDRGTTKKGLGMSVSQITTGAPTISGNTASWLTRSSSQRAYLTNLLPSGATLVNSGLPCQACTADEAADWEPYAELAIDAPGTPLSTQFLSVLEWGPSTLSKSSTTLVQSSSGQNFDCALISSSLVCFMRNWPAAFTGTTYPASGATTQYVSDLAPNTTYTIAGAGAPTSATTDTAGVLTFSASGAGDITIRAVARDRAAAGTIGNTPLYAVAACAVAILVSSSATQFGSNRAAHLDALRQSNGWRSIPLHESLTANRSVLDT
jgi:hypothetical protein